MRQRITDWQKPTALALALVIVAIAAFRSTFGISFADDSFYAAVPLRLALGAHLFTDEATFQATASLLAVPFAAMWHGLFGVSGIILALRLFYVGLATLVGFAVVKSLRPSFGPVMPVAAVSAVLLAPAYYTFAVSYNTATQLAFMLSVGLVFAARRDGSRSLAAGAGALAVLGCVFYPPFVLAALPTAVAAAFVLRQRRLWAWLLGGAAAMIGVAAVWLLATTPFIDLLRTLEFMSDAAYSGNGNSSTILERIATTQSVVGRIARKREWWPAIALGIVVALPLVKGRAKGWLASLLPVAVALPGMLALMRGDTKSFGVPVLSYLLAFTLALIPLAVVSALRRDDGSRDRNRLLLLGGVFSAAAIPLVTLSTSSGFFNGMPGVGATPFALAAIVCWLTLILEWAGKRAVMSAVAVLLVIEVALLFSVSFKDGAPLALDRRFTHGAAAGIRTTAERVEVVETVERRLAGLTRPGSQLLVVSAPLIYTLTDAKALTYATWLGPGPANIAVLDYYRRVGRTPDIVVVSRSLMTEADDAVPLDSTDPLLTWIAREYEPVEGVGFVIMRRR